MASFVEQYQQYISKTILQDLIPHYYGRDKVNNRSIGNGVIVWERASAGNAIMVNELSTNPEPGKVKLCERKHQVDIHVFAIDEDLCDQLVKAEIQALVRLSTVPCSIQSIIYQPKNEQAKTLGFYQIIRVVFSEEILEIPNLKATITKFNLTTNSDKQDGWIDITLGNNGQ